MSDQANSQAPDASPSPELPQTLLDELSQPGRSFVLTSHVNPDGDAIGSELGLSRILEKLGHRVVVWNHDPTPRVYQALPGAERIHVGAAPPPGFPESFDTVILLECPSLDRCGHAEATLRQLPLWNLDHHLGNDAYGAIDWVDPSSASLGAMMYRLALGLGSPIDADTAAILFLTLVTDTGGFRFSNANAEAFDTAAALVREGAKPERVSHWLYESQPESAVRLMGEVIPSLELHHGGTIATAWFTREMGQRVDAKAGDSEGLIDLPRSITGVETVALFRDVEGGVKVSLRSRGEVDIQQLAQRHGGGGHRNAAGFTVHAPESGAVDRKALQASVVDRLREALAAAP